MSTRNGAPTRFLIEGTNFSTDEKGMKRVEALRDMYVGKPLAKEDRHLLQKDIHELYADLRKEGRLFWRDGTVIL